MIRFVVIASLLVGCRVSLETAPDANTTALRGCMVDMASPVCADAVTHSDLTWIQANIFTPSCIFSGCHDSASDLGKLDLKTGGVHDRLVNATSVIEPARKLVVPNDIHASYLMLMLHDFQPDAATPQGTAPAVGYMPLGFGALCCQKLDAIDRWIMAGAPSN